MGFIMVNLIKKNQNKSGITILTYTFLLISTIKNVLASSQGNIPKTTILTAKEQSEKDQHYSSSNNQDKAKNSPKSKKRVTFNIKPEEKNCNNYNNTIDPAMLTVENLLNYNPTVEINIWESSNKMEIKK